MFLFIMFSYTMFYVKHIYILYHQHFMYYQVFLEQLYL